MSLEKINILKKDFEQAEMVLVGIGEELSASHLQENESENRQLIAYYRDILEKKNYFIITSGTDRYIEKWDFNRKRYVQPMLIGADNIDNDVKQTEEKQWDLYNKWLAGTLNKKLLLIELGEGFNNPNLFRWPFEKITMINNKAKLYRVHKNFSQIPEDIRQKAESVSDNALLFLKQLKEQ